jgi:hypothetical protein
MKKNNLLLALTALAASTVASAGTIGTTTIFATDNPFLAGQPGGTTCCSGDSAPAQSPTQITGMTLYSGQILNFAITPGGFFDNGPAVTGAAADGGSYIVSSGSKLGIGGYLSIAANSLVGVFLSDAVPSGTAPGPLDYSVISTNFASFAPSLHQIFFIGNGLRHDGTTVQDFIVPVGATRLFLGSADGYGWANNSGSHDVTVTYSELSLGKFGPTNAVPEPSTFALLATAGVGLWLKKGKA